MYRLLCLLCLAYCGVLQASIPALDERSPFRPGLWWNPDRAGSGFEIQRVDEDAFLIWYTYRSDGSPVWFTAQGKVNEGQMDAVLLEHSWANEAYASYVEVGTIVMRVHHQEAVEIHWEMEGQQGVWLLEPFKVNGIPPEVDHSGAWYQGDRPGYGLTLSEQGTFLFAALYFYDDTGRPVWAVGDNGRQGSEIMLSRFQGTCPYCDFQPPSASVAGSLALRFSNALELEADAVFQVSGWGWSLTAQPLQMLSIPAAARPADRMMVRMGNEDTLVEHLHRGLLEAWRQSWMWDGIDFSASPPSAENVVSATNLQESGVDEMTLLTSDGGWVFAIVQGDISQAPGQVRVARLDPSEGTLDDFQTLHVEIDAKLEPAAAKGLLLTDDRLVVIHGKSATYHSFGPFWRNPWAWSRGSFQIDIFERQPDLQSTPMWRAVIDGHLLTARRVGDQLLLVHRYTPEVEALRYSGNDPAIIAASLETLTNTPLADLLPGIHIDGDAVKALVGPDSVLLPPTVNRDERPDLMLITRIDLRDPSNFESLAVLGDLEAYYVSTHAVYLASSRYQNMQDPLLGVYREGITTTELHKIAITDDRLDYRASGAIEGFLHPNPDRASFRMGEYDGRLRVLSEAWGSIWGALGRHRLTILDESNFTPGLLRTVSILPNDSRPDPIGKPDEMLYGARFIGHRLYAVTFLNIDPLYVIDLSDPADPFIAGEVELPGFSNYLHPLPDGLLLGFGQDAIEAVGLNGNSFAWFQGLKLSLFDVSDPSAPQVLQELSFGKRGSDSALLHHHHGFSFFGGDQGRSARFAIPMTLYGENQIDMPGTSPNQTYPWTRSGLFRFELQGEGAAIRIVELDPIITRSAATGGVQTWHDAVRDHSGRSLLFEGGSLYLGGDQFWLGDWSVPAVISGPH